MSILISDVRLPFPFTEEEALTAARRKLRLSAESVADSCLHKQSLDLRHGELKAICSVELWLNLDEAQFVQKRNDPHVKLRSAPVLPKPEGKKQLSAPPVIIGFGPAGIFAALVLAKNGYRPVVLERGSAMKERDQAVSGFFSSGALSETSNIQFGEGGAGAYSDGKLTTRIGDNRCRSGTWGCAPSGSHPGGPDGEAPDPAAGQPDPSSPAAGTTHPAGTGRGPGARPSC